MNFVFQYYTTPDKTNTIFKSSNCIFFVIWKYFYIISGLKDLLFQLPELYISGDITLNSFSCELFMKLRAKNNYIKHL